MLLSQYAAKNKTDRPPRAVYLREDQLLPGLDRWPADKFSHRSLPQTVWELQDAQDAGGAAETAVPQAAVTAISRHPGPGCATVSGLWDDGYGCTVYLK